MWQPLSGQTDIPMSARIQGWKGFEGLPCGDSLKEVSGSDR